MSPYKERHGPSYADVAEGTERARPILRQSAREIQPFGRIARLPIALDEKVCHEMIIQELRTMARQAADAGDDGTNDLLVSQVLRAHVSRM